MSLVKLGSWSYCLDSDTVDLWAEADRYTLWQSIKRNLNYLQANPRKQRERLYHILGGGTASPKAVRQVNLALSGRTPPDKSTRRVPTSCIRAIEKVSNGASRATVHKHFETSVDYHQERDEGLVPVYRKMDQGRFIAALTHGRPGEVTAAEQRLIEQWAAELKPMLWPMIPPVDELDRCGKCIGISRQAWRGSWFGGVEDDLRRKLFWQNLPIKKYLNTHWINSTVPIMMLHPTPRQQLMDVRQFAGRLAIIAVIISNSLMADEQHYEGSMWNLNRLLPLDARRWLNVQYSWIPDVTNGLWPTNPWIREMLQSDYTRVRDWISSPSKYPTVYSCAASELWPVLEQSAWFWFAFIDAINGRGWGDSQAARYIRGEI